MPPASPTKTTGKQLIRSDFMKLMLFKPEFPSRPQLYRHHRTGQALGGGREEAEGKVVCLFLHHPPRVPGILPTHGPRAFGEAFGVGSDNYENSD